MKQQKPRIYQIDFQQILKTSAIPILSFLIFGSLFCYDIKTENSSSIQILAFVIFLIFTTGIYIFLLFNHLRIARQTVLKIVNRQININQFEKSATINFEDIKEIIEFSTAKLPWSRLIIWEINTTNNHHYRISSLTISKSEFERFFWNKIETKTKLFPSF